MFALTDAPLYYLPDDPRSDAARRIMSVMPFLTGRARRWLRRLPARARAQLDIEDVVQDLWAKLLAADEHFDPAKAAYITFASVVVDRHLQRLGDQLCRGPRREPLGCDLSDARGSTPEESAMRAEARERASEAVSRAVGRLDDRRHFVVTRIYGIGVEPMSVRELSEWLARSPSQVIGYRTEAEDEIRAALAG